VENAAASGWHLKQSLLSAKTGRNLIGQRNLYPRNAAPIAPRSTSPFAPQPVKGGLFAIVLYTSVYNASENDCALVSWRLTKGREIHAAVCIERFYCHPPRPPGRWKRAVTT